VALTLFDYARTQFPDNHLDAWPERQSGSQELRRSTLVAHIVGADATTETFRALHDGAGDVPVAAVIVRPVEPTVIPQGDEASESVFDLPNRRVLASVATGVAAGIALGMTFALWFDLGLVGVLALLVFTTGAGAALGFITGGGSRHASNKADSQPHAPGTDIGVVAAFTDDEHIAAELAQLLYSKDQFDVRIVAEDGGWHSPND
jgi:hypothetical protein